MSESGKNQSINVLSLNTKWAGHAGWIRVCFAGLVLLAGTACQTLTEQKLDGNKSINDKKISKKVEKIDPSQFAMDTTVGSYGTGRERRLVLVTIDLEKHSEIVKSGASDATGTENSTGIVLPARYAALMNEWSERYGLTRVADWAIPPLDVSCLIFESNGRTKLKAIVEALNNLPIVDIAQPVQHFSVVQNRQYNDPYLPLQHAVHTMQAEYPHRWSLGKDVTIAVIDTGVDTSHPEIRGRATNTYNFVDQDELQFRSDVHGTAVAGVIAARANNKTGMVGIAPLANILPMKACWQTGDGNDSASCNSITLLKALDNAIQDKVDVINLSLAGPRDPLLEQLTKKALELNIIVVGARSSERADYFPANVAGTIGVAQIDDTVRGVIKAPGNNILSLHPNRAYDFFNGSSFSTAHISGLAALIRQLKPEWSPSNVKSLIEITSEHSGAVNACRAIGYIVEADLSVCDL